MWRYLTQFFLEWKIFQTKAVEKIKAYILCSITLFWNLCHLSDYVEKYGTAKQATDGNIILCMHIACWLISLHTHTQNMQYLLLFYSNSGYAYTSQCHICIYYIACFVCNLHHFIQKRRELRRRTWCGHASRKSLFSITPSLQTIDENSAHFFKQECLSTTIQDLANNSKTLNIFI